MKFITKSSSTNMFKITFFSLFFTLTLQAYKVVGQETLITSMPKEYLLKLAPNLAGIRPLEVRDSMPDIQLGKVYGEIFQIKDTFVSISTFRGKPLILDFWSNWCASCIAQFPKLKALQDKFGDAMQILPIGFTSSGYGDIHKALKKWDGTFLEMKLPTIIELKGKSLLQALFPFQSLPTIVWIDKNGVVLGITDHYSLNEKNIADIIAGKSVEFRRKKKLRFIEPHERFLIQNPKDIIDEKGLVSATHSFIDDLYPSMGLDEVSDSQRLLHVVGINSTIFELFRSAYIRSNDKYSFLKGFLGVKKTIEVSNFDPVFQDRDIINDNTENWKVYEFESKNIKNYEAYLEIGREGKSELYKKIIKDLELKFNVKSKIEVRSRKCYALIKLPTYESLKESHYKRDTMFTDKYGIIHVSLQSDAVIERLNGFTTSLIRDPIINCTGIQGQLSFKFPFKIYSLEALRKELNKSGLDLVHTEREMELLVLNFGNNNF